MKVYLNLEELKTIQDALYSSINNIKKETAEIITPKLREIADNGVAEREKLLLYINDLIKKEEV